MQIKSKLFSTFLTIFLLGFTGCEQKNSSDNILSAVSPETKPSFKLISQTDEKIEITQTENGFQFKGLEDKVVLLNFFATWCPPCKAEIPHLINLQNKYKKDFAIIAVLVEEGKEQNDLNTFIREYGINYIVSNTFDNVRLSKAVGGVRSIPTMIMYDKNGNYYNHYIGAVPEEMLELDIKKAMEVK
jgi:thiol-disulfide isomerase/thioredoxin